MAQQGSLPAHVGFILDGNRRWARSKGLPGVEGHRAGYENLKTIALEAFRTGIPYVSAYVFSTENWKRSKTEVSYLMRLLLWVGKHEVGELHKEKIQVVFAGRRDKLSAKIVTAMEKAETTTKNNTGGTLMICLDYGGKQEIVDSVNDILRKNPNMGEVTEQDIEQHLYSPNIPPLDLLIRTSGEHRISNFMLWRAAYAELLFVDKHWPDFTSSDLRVALVEYRQRSRRFGV